MAHRWALTYLIAASQLGVADLAAAPPPAASVSAPRNCTIRCTLENGKYSWFTSERCLNALTKRELDDFNHKCVVALEGTRRGANTAREQVQRRCKAKRAPSNPESAEHFRNCDNPLTTDDYYREVHQWLSRDEPKSDAEAEARMREFQRILERERQRQATINSR